MRINQEVTSGAIADGQTENQGRRNYRVARQNTVSRTTDFLVQ